MQRAVASMIVLGALAALAACGDDGASAPADAREVDAPPACHGQKTLFLNRLGGTYLPGVADSSANTTPLLTRNATVFGPDATDSNWNNFVDCMRVKFAPFNLAITEEDPGAIEHTELVVIGTGDEIGQPAGILGFAPTPCANGAPPFQPRAIVFLMWNAGGHSSNAFRCFVAAQGVAQSMGLDTVIGCPDVMSTAVDCGLIANKQFTNTILPCGDTATRACRCGGQTQVSRQYLTSTLGIACD